MRLLPSLNEWFSTVRQSRLAAFSSTLGQRFRHARRSVVNRTHRAFERLVLLVGEQCAAAKLVAQHLQRLHRILIGRAERLLGSSGRYLQLLIIVAVERIEAVGVIRNHAQQPDRLGFRNILCSQNIGEQADGLFQLLQLFGFGLAVNRIAFY